MYCKQSHRAHSIGFSDERFLQALSAATGIQPVGLRGTETLLDLTSLESARGSLLMREVYSKYDDGKPSETKSIETWKRFHAAEEACLETNRVFVKCVNYDPFWVSVRRRVASTLGCFSWDECAKFFAFGPGSTTRLTKRESYAAYKYSGKPESTSGNSVLARCAIKHLPVWERTVRTTAEVLDDDGLVTVVPGNVVIPVRKNYKTDRTIAKEPCMNIYVQKGIGRVIRNRLRRVGVNLDDQTRNQRGAFEGSLTGELATVDLSMASDTLSYEVVGWLLPLEWWYALEQCRSPIGVLPSGAQIRYQKFSSMGNGYTFELESLIFWAIAQQVCCENVNEKEMSICVYGDDIIIPSRHYDHLAWRLFQAGFTLNLRKSYASGPYRESCGKHYYNGVDITPFYVRKPVRELDRLFLVHNNFVRWGDRTGLDVSQLTASLRELAPASWRFPRLPDGYGDGAFIGPVDSLRLDSHPYGWEGWQVSALSRSTVELECELPAGQIVASLKASLSRTSLLSSYQLSAFLGRSDFLPVPSWYLCGSELLSSVEESPSGLPVRAGRYKQINIFVPRHPPAKAGSVVN